MATNPDNIVALSSIHIGTGASGTIAMVARVSIVDFRGQILLDTMVAPSSTPESYHTSQTGYTAASFEGAPPFQQVQELVAARLRGKVIVGHAMWTDLQVLGLSHPAVETRDVGLFLPFRQAIRQQNQVVGLPSLVWHLLRRKIGAGLHDSLENARAAMDLYRSHRQEWEGEYNTLYLSYMLEAHSAVDDNDY